MRVVRCGWILALSLLPLASPAAGFDVVAGPSVTSSGHRTSAVFASVFGEAPADGRSHFRPIGTLGWVFPHATHVDNLHHPVGLVAGGVRIESPHRHWFLGEQLAATTTTTDALSSRFEFMTSAGWQHGHLTVMLRHVSNAHVLGGGKNLGETMLLAGLRL